MLTLPCGDLTAAGRTRVTGRREGTIASGSPTVTRRHGRLSRRERTYEMGTAYGHIAIGVDDLEGTLAELADQGIEPERPRTR
jgi:hypothetical protein